MGASNVAKVFVKWRHLSDRDLRVLVFMANVTLDQDNPPVYFGGWEALAESMQKCGSKRTVMKILQSLSEAGAVVSSGQARAGVRAEYALTLNPEVTYRPTGAGRQVGWVAVDRKDPRVNATDTLRVNATDTLRVNSTDTQWVNTADTLRVNATDTPRNNLRNNRGIQEKNTDSQPSVTTCGKPGDDDNDENLPLTQEQEIARQTAALQKIYGPDLQGVTDEPETYVERKVRRRNRGRETATAGTGDPPR